jgi:hypothetical protein
MKEVIIVGGGYSIKEGIEKGLWEKIKDKNVWSLNFAFNFMPFIPTKQIWADTSVWEKCKNEILELHNKGTQLVCRNYGGYEEYPFIERYNTSEDTYLGSKATDTLFIGSMGLVGVFALSYAAKLQFDNVYLLGYDFGAPNTETWNTHFYQAESEINAGAYGDSKIYWDGLRTVRKGVHEFKKFKDDLGYTIYNVSKISNIPHFEKISYEDFFDYIK